MDNTSGLGEQMRQMMANRQAVARLAGSPDARALMELLGGMGGVEQAARSAVGGDAGALRAMVEGLMNSPQGAELARRIGEQARQEGLEDV